MQVSREEFKVSIGDIAISVAGKRTHSYRIDDPYRAFITEDKAEVQLQLLPGTCAIGEDQDNIFKAQDAWSISQKDEIYIIKTTSGKAIFDKKFQSGKFYGNGDSLDSPLGYPLAEILMINLLAMRWGILMHACGIAYKGAGLLFIGSSGAGKSTTANLWKDEEGAVILSDDRIIIRKIDSKFWMYGTPWHGEAHFASPERAPLKKIFFLKHARENMVQEMSPLDTSARLIVCSFPPFWDKQGMDSSLDFCTELARVIPSYELGFVPDKSALDFIRTKT